MKDDRTIAASFCVMAHAKRTGNENVHKIASSKLVDEMLNYMPKKIKFNSDEYWDLICWKARIELHQKIDEMFMMYPHLNIEMSDSLKEYHELVKYYSSALFQYSGVNMAVKPRDKFFNFPPSA